MKIMGTNKEKIHFKQVSKIQEEESHLIKNTHTNCLSKKNIPQSNLYNNKNS